MICSVKKEENDGEHCDDSIFYEDTEPISKPMFDEHHLQVLCHSVHMPLLEEEQEVEVSCPKIIRRELTGREREVISLVGWKYPTLIIGWCRGWSKMVGDFDDELVQSLELYILKHMRGPETIESIRQEMMEAAVRSRLKELREKIRDMKKDAAKLRSLGDTLKKAKLKMYRDRVVEQNLSKGFNS